MNIQDEDEDFDNFEEQDEQESNSSKVSEKIEDAKDKIDDARDLVDKIKNNSNKSGTPDNSNAETKQQKKEDAREANKNKDTNKEAGKDVSKEAGKDASRETGKEASKEVSKDASKEVAKEGTKVATEEGTKAAVAEGTTAAGAGAAGASAGAAAIAPVILVIIVVVLIIMIVIGILSFLIDGLGLISEKFLEFAEGIGTNIVSMFCGEDEALVGDETIQNVGTYLEEMGYDLEGFGFLNSEGKITTKEDTFNDDGTGTRKIKDSNGNVILEREITKSPDGQITEGKINKIESHCIWAYLVAENRTYLVYNGTDTTEQAWYKPWSYLVNLAGKVLGDDYNGGSGMIQLYNHKGDYIHSNAEVTIDRENEEMLITHKRSKYKYSLDGWTGKYGKSLEFLLTLHLATMAPDFAKEVALNEAFDAKVQVRLYEVNAYVKLLDGNGNPITEDNYEDAGLTQEEYNDLKKEYNREITIYTPYIYQVEKHWFYELIDFSNSYEEIVNDGYDDNYSDNTENRDFTYEYEYEKNGKKFIIQEVRQGDIYQIAEPEVTPREYTSNSDDISLQRMLLGGVLGKENTEEDYKYYIYDGSPLVEGREEREKRYIMEKIGYGDNTKYVMDTRMFQYAFAILESVHTQDAEFVLRDLKKLFYSLGIEIEAEENEEEIGELEWIIPEYIPINWDPMFNTTETELRINYKKDNKSGFKPDLDVVMPADGKVIKVSDDEDGTQTVKIEFTGEDDSSLTRKTIYIRGLVSNVEADKKYKRGNTIGKTAKKDITVIMTNKNHSVITNVDKYLCPPEENN